MPEAYREARVSMASILRARAACFYGLAARASWATAILTPLPGQTTKITFYIVFNAIGPLLLGLMNARVGEAARGGIPGAVTVSRCRCSCPRRRGKYDEDVVKQAVFGPSFSRSRAIFFRRGMKKTKIRHTLAFTENKCGSVSSHPLHSPSSRRMRI